MIELGQTDSLMLRSVILYLPVAILFTALFIRKGSKRRTAAVVISSAVIAGFILAGNLIVIELDWWGYAESIAVAGVPVEIWIGWTILWGAVPAALLPDRPRLVHNLAVLACLVYPRFLAMLLLEPVVVLSGNWLLGEVVMLVGASIPSLDLSSLTLSGTGLQTRVGIQAAGFSVGFLVIPPAIAFAATGETLEPLLGLSTWQLVMVSALLVPPFLLASTALVDLVTMGRGTPVPLDPSNRLVTTDPYAYISNPIQTGMTLLMADYVGVLQSWGVAATSVVAGTFSVGTPAILERDELAERFGTSWESCRSSVRAFMPRWTPLSIGDQQPATLWMASKCGECRQTADWIFDLNPVGLERRTVEECPTALSRVTYQQGERTATGVAAIGHAFEHINLGWVLLGWLLRLPVPTLFFQIVAGTGPQRWVSVEPEKTLAPNQTVER